MRLPNGYGSVFKLKGKRRRPWVARRTVGYNDRGQQIFEYVGYYETRAAALEALAGRSDPERRSVLTLAEVFDLYDERILCNRSDHYREMSLSLWRRHLAPLGARKIGELSLPVIQDHVRTLPASIQRPVLTLLHGILKEAVRRELLPAGAESVTGYVETEKHTARKKEPFSEELIARLWEESSAPDAALALVLVYTGLRLGELLALAPEDVSDEILQVRQSKTAAGVRSVPIHHRIRPLLPGVLEYVAGKSQHVVRYHWRAFFEPRGVTETPHACRHTCVTRLVEAGVDPRLVRTIVGHAGGSVTDDVYTHVRPEILLEAIERLP